TDDRYADDIHYMGGCLLGDKLRWASTMFAHNARPPDPAVVGERWRDLWQERLRGGGLWLETWLRHQRRGGHATDRPGSEGLGCPRLPGPGRRRVAGRVHQRDPPAHAGTVRAPHGDHRPLGPPLSPHGGAGARHRIPPARRALVGHVAPGSRQRADEGTRG